MSRKKERQPDYFHDYLEKCYKVVESIRKEIEPLANKPTEGRKK